MKNIEKTLKYYELLMIKDIRKQINPIPLPDGFSFVFWDNDNCINDWVNIHIETGEFNSLQNAFNFFHDFYDNFYAEISKRCIFIVNKKGEKIATATVSPTREYGYNCAIDWFAISPKAQGLQLSKPLLSKVISIAKELGYKDILLHTQTHTWLAAKIYLDFGFTPYKTQGNQGWDILKTITQHPKLCHFKTLKPDELYDQLILKIKKELDKLHNNYNYSVWYKNNRKDIYVRENENYFEYQYSIENEKIKLTKK